MKITNNRGGHVTIVPHPEDKKGETIVLNPGENELTDSQWDKISGHKTIVALLEKKAVHVGGKKHSKQTKMRRHPDEEEEMAGSPSGLVMKEKLRQEQRDADALYEKQQAEGKAKAKTDAEAKAKAAAEDKKIDDEVKHGHVKKDK